MQKSNVSSVQIVDRRSLTELLSQLKNRLDAQAAALSKEIEDIMLRIDTLMGVRKDGTVIDVSAAIDTFNDIKDFLEGIEGTTLSSLLDQIRSNMPHPDWNENSPNSPNYIANRTHYEDGGPGIVYEEFEGAENTSHSFTTYYSLLTLLLNTAWLQERGIMWQYTEKGWKESPDIIQRCLISMVL